MTYYRIPAPKLRLRMPSFWEESVRSARFAAAREKGTATSAQGVTAKASFARRRVQGAGTVDLLTAQASVAQRVAASDTAGGHGLRGAGVRPRNGMLAVQGNTKFQVRPLYLQVRDAL